MKVKHVYLSGKTTLGGQTPVGFDYVRAPFQASILVDVISGSISYAIDFTLDNIDGHPSTIRWLSDTVNFPKGLTTGGLFNIYSPIVAVRLNLQSFTGEVRFTVLQPAPL